MRGSAVPIVLRRKRRVGPSRAQAGYSSDDIGTEYEGIELIASRRWMVLPNHPLRSAWDWVLISECMATHIIAVRQTVPHWSRPRNQNRLITTPCLPGSLSVLHSARALFGSDRATRYLLQVHQDARGGCS
jgi:hypothetical protein